MHTIENNKYGRLTAISFSHRERKGKKFIYFWNCICVCGNKIVSRRDHLTSGNVKSCKCLQKEKVKAAYIKRNTTHGATGTRFYSRYRGIVRRCNFPSMKCYKDYGGRGIKCLWKTFEEFRKDMFESYVSHIEKFGYKNTSIERIDNNGNYCKDNCRWATPYEQSQNRRPRTIKSNKTFGG